MRGGVVLAARRRRQPAQVAALDLLLRSQPQRINRQTEPLPGRDHRLERRRLAERVFAVGERQHHAPARFAVEHLKRLGNRVIESRRSLRLERVDGLLHLRGRS